MRLRSDCEIVRLWMRTDGGREARRQVLLVTDLSCQPEAASLLLPPFFLTHNIHACSCTIAVASMSLIVYENVNHFNVECVYFTISSLLIFHFEFFN